MTFRTSHCAWRRARRRWRTTAITSSTTRSPTEPGCSARVPSLRQLACELAVGVGLAPIELYAERLGEIEARNVLAHPGSYDGHRAALEATTWRELQLVQIEHDRHYHPDVIGLAKDEQLRHYALHLSKVVGAFAEPRDREELLRRRLPDVLLFGVKLWTVMGARLPDERFPALTPPRPAGPQPATAR